MIPDCDVLIVGGGIIGAACAYELTRRGVAVTVIDKGEMGHGCSFGNAGWVTPGFALPLPMPGTLSKSLKWLLDSGSPLYIQPRLSWTLIRWLVRFMRSMNKRQAQRSVAALTELTKFSLSSYRALDAQDPGSFGFQQRGLLVVAQTITGHAAARLELELVAQYGISGHELNTDQIRKLEPAITGPDVCGGIFFPDDAHVEPFAAVTAMLRQAEASGARLYPHTEVYDLLQCGRRVNSVQTTRGPIKADQIVFATGAWSPQFSRSLGQSIPLLSGKGYAITIEPFFPMPKIPCMLIERKVAVTPCENSVRLSGTMELTGIDESITARRVKSIIHGSRQYMNLPPEPRAVKIWRGLRPCTPDGMPIIGRTKTLDNVVIATGHQMLGLQTAPATGWLVADLLTGQIPKFDPTPFRSERF